MLVNKIMFYYCFGEKQENMNYRKVASEILHLQNRYLKYSRFYLLLLFCDMLQQVELAPEFVVQLEDPTWKAQVDRGDSCLDS